MALTLVYLLVLYEMSADRFVLRLAYIGQKVFGGIFCNVLVWAENL
jgi:hypothetical protein